MDEERTTASGRQERANRPAEQPVPILRRRSVLWRHLDAAGFQLARFSDTPDGHILDGRVLTAFDGYPAEVHFTIMCSSDWTTRRAFATVVHGTANSTLQLRRDAAGRWWLARGEQPFSAPPNESPLDGFDDLIDVDLAISPATNTLPIRRLDLAIGEARDSDALWVGFPDFAIERLQQRYTRESERVYRYESGGGTFTARLEVDDDGIVISYGDFWDRVAASASGSRP